MSDTSIADHTKPGDPPFADAHHPNDIRIDDVTDCPILTFRLPGREPLSVRLTNEAAAMVGRALVGGRAPAPGYRMCLDRGGATLLGPHPADVSEGIAGRVLPGS